MPHVIIIRDQTVHVSVIESLIIHTCKNILDSVQQNHPYVNFYDKSYARMLWLIINSVPYNFMADSPILDAYERII